MRAAHLFRPSILASLVALVPFASGEALAQKSPPAGGVQLPGLRQENAEELDARATKEKRVLRLADGRVLRALSHWTGTGWEIRSDGKWMKLEAESVLSWRGEKELLRERARRARALEHRDLDGHAELAEWLVLEGLGDEALKEIDGVLREDPDHPAALKLIHVSPFARPNGGDPREEPKLCTTRLIGAAVSAGPARRELCILGLGALLETPRGREVLQESLARELISYRVLRRTFAAHALRRLMPGDEVYELLRRCALDTSRPVREAAARALHDTGEPGIVAPLVKALSSESRPVRTNAAEALGNIGYPVAVPALVAHFASLPVAAGSSGTRPPAANIHISTEFAYVGDYDVEIAQGASIADPIVMHVQTGVVLDARVGGVSGYTKITEYKVVRRSLEQLTGAAPGSSQADWQRWYEENRERFEPREPQEPTRSNG